MPADAGARASVPCLLKTTRGLGKVAFGHQTLYRKDDAMKQFIQRHAGQVIGTLGGWDRLRFRGTLRMLANLTDLGGFAGFFIATACLE